MISIYFAVTVSITASENRTVYLFPDTYKEMSIGRTLSQGNGWGVSKTAVTPCASLLYPVLLGVLYKIFGVKESIPAIVNAGAGFFVICLLWYFFRKEKMRQISAMATAFFIYLSSSIPFLIMQGNEILIMMSASLILVYFAAQPVKNTNINIAIYICSITLGAISPEGLIVVLSAAIILSTRKEYKLAGIIVLAAAILPAVGWGLGIWNGYEAFDFIKPEKIADILFQKEYLFPLTVLTLSSAASYMIHGLNSKYASMCRIVLMATVLKILFMPQAYIPESYLFSSAFAIFAVSIAGFGMIPDKPKRDIKTSVILGSCFLVYAMFLYPMVKRGVNTYSLIPAMSRNIYERSYRLGEYVKECCDKRGVVSDDPGAMAYLADINFIGIGKAAPLKSKEEDLPDRIKNNDGVIFIASAENADKYKKYLPKESVKIREWIISGPDIEKESVVFYCLRYKDSRDLWSKINNFSAYLPPDIKIK